MESCAGIFHKFHQVVLDALNGPLDSSASLVARASKGALCIAMVIVPGLLAAQLPAVLLAPLLVVMSVVALTLPPGGEVKEQLVLGKTAKQRCMELEREIQAAQAEAEHNESKRKRNEEKQAETQEKVEELESELSALGNAEDRINFLTKLDEVTTVSAERAFYKQQHIAVEQACQQHKLKCEEMQDMRDSLQSQVSELTIEVDSAKACEKQLEKEKTGIQTKLDASERLLSEWQEKALVLEEDVKASQKMLKKEELHAEAGQEDMRREFESKELAEKKKAKNEDRHKRMLSDEKKLAEMSLSGLQTALMDLDEDVENVREKLEVEQAEREKLEQSLEQSQKEVDSLKEQARNLEKVEKETIKEQQKKKKKDNELKDLELEIASVRGEAEKSKHDAEKMKAEAAERFAKMQEQLESMDADRRKVYGEMQKCIEKNRNMANEGHQLQQKLEEQAGKMEALDAKLKESEREKIRLRIDLKKLGDSKQELEDTMKELSA